MAWPGTSPHEGGLAIDVNFSALTGSQQNTLIRIARDHHFDWSPKDKVHFQSMDPLFATSSSRQAEIGATETTYVAGNVPACW